MKVCPHCGNQIPDDNNNIYCPYCNHIANEEVLLRMKIERELRGPEGEQKKPVRSKRHDDDDYETVRVSNDRNPYVSAAISIAVLAAVIVAAYFLLR